MNKARIVWGVGVLAYAATILQRTSLGVASAEASEHFGVSPGVLSTFIVVQLLTYAGMQIPAGLLLDRFGSRLMIASGLLIMAGGQVLMAFASTLGLGFTARIIVAIGDSFIFGSVLRLIPAWFPTGWVPLLSQMSGLIGAMGQLAAGTAFLASLHAFGWQPAFLAAGGLALVWALVAGTLVSNGPDDQQAAPPPSARDLPSHVVRVWSHPGTRLGLWTNMTAGFSAMVFAMMWGMPYLTMGEGLTPQQASGYYSLLVLASVLFGPTVGLLTARHPLRRSNLVFVTVLASALPWIVLMLWPGRAPGWLLALLVIGLAMGGPGSGIGMDYARTSVPHHQLGTANGIVIVGSFTAAVLNIWLIGAILDWISPGGAYSLADFRLAFAVQIPFWIAGTLAMLITRRRLRRAMAEQGVIVPPWRVALRREWLRRRYGR